MLSLGPTRGWLTFVVEDALHLHATSGVSNAQGATGHEAFCCRGPVSGADQTPVRLVVRPFQNLYCLATPDGQLIAVASCEVMNHYRQLAAARKLGRTKREGQVSKQNHSVRHGYELG